MPLENWYKYFSISLFLFNLVENKPDVLKDIVYPKGFNKSQTNIARTF